MCCVCLVLVVVLLLLWLSLRTRCFCYAVAQLEQCSGVKAPNAESAAHVGVTQAEFE